MGSEIDPKIWAENWPRCIRWCIIYNTIVKLGSFFNPNFGVNFWPQTWGQKLTPKSGPKNDPDVFDDVLFTTQLLNNVYFSAQILGSISDPRNGVRFFWKNQFWSHQKINFGRTKKSISVALFWSFSATISMTISDFKNVVTFFFEVLSHQISISVAQVLVAACARAGVAWQCQNN